MGGTCCPSFQLDNENIGPVFSAVRCLSKLVFPIGSEHEEASVLRDISSRSRPEAVSGGAVGVCKPPNLGSLSICLRAVDLIFPWSSHERRSSRRIRIGRPVSRKTDGSGILRIHVVPRKMRVEPE